MGIRVWKTAVAAVAAIYIAQWCGLSFPYSAGLLSVLGVDVTRKRTLMTMLQRIGASLIGLAIGSMIFLALGFYVWTFGLFILLAYPLMVRMKLKDGVVTSSVILMHVYSVERIDWPTLGNEIGLLLIGFGTAGIINMLYMPGTDKRLLELRENTEDAFAAIFQAIAKHLREPDTVWSGAEYIEAEACIRQGRETAARLQENQLFRSEPYWPLYFAMRQSQYESIGRMLDIVAQVYRHLPHGELTATLFDELSRDVRSETYEGRVEKAIAELEREFRDMELPATRIEFEIRSAILQLIIELKQYLAYAKDKKKPGTNASR